MKLPQENCWGRAWWWRGRCWMGPRRSFRRPSRLARRTRGGARWTCWSGEAYFAIADECKKKGITFDGHVPDAIRASEASNAGQKSFEHLIGIFEGSSTGGDELLKGPKGR